MSFWNSHELLRGSFLFVSFPFLFFLTYGISLREQTRTSNELLKTIKVKLHFARSRLFEGMLLVLLYKGESGFSKKKED